MRFPLIGKNGSIFIGNLRPFWINFYRLMGNAYLSIVSWHWQMIALFRTNATTGGWDRWIIQCGHGTIQCASSRALTVRCRKHRFFLNFPYVCPEPVLAK